MHALAPRSLATRAVAILSTLVAATALAVAVPSPAHAAVPPCNGYNAVHFDPPYIHYWMPTTSNSTLDWRCTLRSGDGYAGGGRQIAVWILQGTLNECYGQGLTQDGLYGPATVRAVKNVQNFHNVHGKAGLAVDGIYGPATAYWMFLIDTRTGQCQV